MDNPQGWRLSIKAGCVLGLVGVLFSVLLALVRAVPEGRPGNVSAQAWQATGDGSEGEFLVILDEQADLGAAAALPSRGERLHYVHETLLRMARRSQAELRRLLDRLDVDYRPFYVANVMAVQGKREILLRLAARPEVARIAANPRVRLSLPVPRFGEVRPLAPRGVEWNVSRINADDVWDLGYTGRSIVVAGQDTGYDWDHPALKEQYRGYNGGTATHDYNWHDAIHSGGGSCGADSPVPCDDLGHGTHTMGTIVGDDGGENQIGVAPGARWIGCRNMDEGVGRPSTYIECFEFFLAPYPVGGDPERDGEPARAPHVINNSWVCPPREGCDWDTLQTVVENVRAAGIVVVASAGNEGASGCGSVEDPPAIYDAAFSVGTSNSSDTIAYFSSRGPVTVDGSGRRKPDVTAPGVDVRSSRRGGDYTRKSGTSMAGPHVAGTVALLWSAAPSLIGDVDATEQVIGHTARARTTTESCGGDGPDAVPNNVYGWGIVDALAAVESARPPLQVAKRATVSGDFWARSLSYTLTVTNTSEETLTHVVLTDAILVSTTFARAGGNYATATIGSNTVVSWTAASLAPQAKLTATLMVTVDREVGGGERVVNADYGVRAGEAPTPVMGIPVEMVIPWRYLLFPVFKGWSAEEGDG